MKNNILVGIVTGVIVLVGASFVLPGEVIERVTVGAIPGDTIESPSVMINGVRTFFYTSQFRPATTTACVFRSPQATTTVQLFTAQPTRATSSAFTAILATSTVNNVSLSAASQIASTTHLASYQYAADSAALFLYAPASLQTALGAGQSAGATTTAWVLPPNTYVIYAGEGGGIISSGSSQFQAGGTCNLELRAVRSTL